MRVEIELTDAEAAQVDRQAKSRQETRSEFILRALRQQMHAERDREAVGQYVEAYRRQPETDEEIALAEATIADAFAEDPWE